MEESIFLSNCWDKLPDNQGYVSTFVRINKKDNTLLYVSYRHYKEFGDSKHTNFNTYQELLDSLKAS